MAFWLVILLCMVFSLASAQDEDIELVCRPRQPPLQPQPCGKELEPDWHLVFKAVAGVADAQETDQFLIDPYAVWNRQAPYNEDVPAARKLDSRFKDHYKSSLVLNWHRRNIQEVKVTLLDDSGNELVNLVFDGQGSDQMNWFSKDRLLDSPWSDVLIEPHNYFSVVGHGDQNHRRRWFINRNYSGCAVDAGWLVVVGRIPRFQCDWENLRSRVAKPIFLYSKEKTHTNWNIETNVGEADIFAIFVKTNSRY